MGLLVVCGEYGWQNLALLLCQWLDQVGHHLVQEFLLAGHFESPKILGNSSAPGNPWDWEQLGKKGSKKCELLLQNLSKVKEQIWG